MSANVTLYDKEHLVFDLVWGEFIDLRDFGIDICNVIVRGGDGITDETIHLELGGRVESEWFLQTYHDFEDYWICSERSEVSQ